MRFTNPKRRQPPAVIIISLIDVLIVMLIFMMVTTTFKRQPALKLALPESKQPKEGVSDENLIVTIRKEPPYFYLDTRQVTFEKLQEEFVVRVKKNPKITVSISSDKAAPMGEFVRVIDAANAAGVRSQLRIHTQAPVQR